MQPSEALTSNRVTKAGRQLTERMVETLTLMKKGAKVESEKFFSWPRWLPIPEAKVLSSIGCPTRAMLEGLNQRGLLSISLDDRQWIIEINDAGRDALLAHETAKNARKASPFKRYGISYQDGNMRASSPPVTARTEAEALAKLKKELQRRGTDSEYSEFRVDWVGKNG
jgi:hypothetical protein